MSHWVKTIVVTFAIFQLTPLFAAETQQIASVSYVNKITDELDTKVDMGSAQTISGEKTFSASPLVPTPPLPQDL